MGKEVNMEIILKASDYLKKRLILCQSGQSTLEYAMVTVIAIVISAVLIAVGKPYIIEIISNVFEKISGMV
jgi:Flp pilus assembly pilin Flp